MATGTINNFTIYQAQFQTGVIERVAQNVAAFNAASNNCITLETQLHPGNFLQSANYVLGSGMRVRTLSSVADISDVPLTQGEEVAPKISWADGPYADTADAFAKISADPNLLYYVLGQQAGEKLSQMMLNSACAALKGVLFAPDAAFGANQYDSSGLSANDTVSYVNLIRSLAKLGDRGASVACWLMDGASLFKLTENSTTIATDLVAGATISRGGPPTLGRPVIATDSSYLRVDASSVANDKSLVYGLLPGAIRVIVSEDMRVILDDVTGKVNLIKRYQAEGAYTVYVRGAKWSTGAVNPSDATLATKTNWTKNATSVKDGPGCVLIAQGSFN